jgi:hypothetical protein
MNDDFYIGWEDKAPPSVRRSVRRAIGVLMVMAVALPIAFAVAQRMISASVFEWGVEKQFTGTLKLAPYPHLLVPRPQADTNSAAHSTYHLVAPWKFGLDTRAIAQFDDHVVTIKGTLIYRASQTMVETQPEWIVPATNAATPLASPAVEKLGRQKLVGEIVDSKCFLGVMNPGQLTPHRACAIRCISGGVPPVLLVRQKDAAPLYFLLVSVEGKPVNGAVLEMVAEPVAIEGEVERHGDLLILRADPATYRRLN